MLKVLLYANTTRHLSRATRGSGSGVEKFVNILKNVEQENLKTSGSETNDTKEQSRKSFPDLLRTSPLMHLGSLEGRNVFGIIEETVGDDLYINFGGKFNCVCRRPNVNKGEYHTGVSVRLKLIDWEMTSYFMGAAKDLTLLEADAVLLGLANEPVKDNYSQSV